MGQHVRAWSASSATSTKSRQREHVTTIEVLDLLTIRECIEILVDRRTGRDRTPSLPPAVVDYLGATHVRPRAWTGSEDLLRRFDCWGGRPLCKPEDQRRYKCCIYAFVRIPSENPIVDRIHIALPSDVLRCLHDCLAPFNGSEIRIRRSELQAWLGRHRKLLDRTKFRRRSPRRPKSGRPDQQFGLAINAIRELYRLGLPADKSQREIARQAVAEAHSRYGASISVRSAQRAVGWVSKRRSARK
jgi:hypothetical protein